MGSVDDIWAAMQDADRATTRHRRRVHSILSGARPEKVKSGPRVKRAGTGHLTSEVTHPLPGKVEESRLGGCEGRGGPSASPGTTVAEAGADMTPEEAAASMLKQWQRYINMVSEGDSGTRKAALQTLYEGLTGAVERWGRQACPGQEPGTLVSQTTPIYTVTEAASPFLEDTMALLFDKMAKPLFKRFADPAERCRDLSIRMVILFLQHISDMTPHLAYLIPALMARGVPQGVYFDAELELFVDNAREHEAYRRGKATERQDRRGLGGHSVAEPSEEIRLHLCRLMKELLRTLSVRGTAGVLKPYCDDMLLYVHCQTRDPYPALKVEALTLAKMLATQPQLELAMKFYAVGLTRSILPQLRHRHAKVRLAAIDAVRQLVKVPDRAKVKGAGTAAIVDLVGFREDNVLPVAAFYGRGDTLINHLAELTADESATVRECTVAMLGDWMTTLPDRYDHQTRLLPYLLNGITDEAKAVSESAMKSLALCGAEYEREHEDEIIERRQLGVDGDIRANHDKPLPAPFNTRPRIGVRLYVRGNTRRFLQPLLTELTNWMSKTRLQSALLFRTLVVYCEEHLTVEIHKLIPHLQKAVGLAHGEKDLALEGVLLECCELIGRFVIPGSYLPHTLPHMKRDVELAPSGADARARAALFKVVSKLIEGTSPKTLLPHITHVLEAVTGDLDEMECDTVHMQLASIDVLLAVATSMSSQGQQAHCGAQFLATGRLASLRPHMQSCVRYLLVCQAHDTVRTKARQCLECLALAAGISDAGSLVVDHANGLIKFCTEEYPVGPAWSIRCPQHLLLESLFFAYPAGYGHQAASLPQIIILWEQLTTDVANFQTDQRETVLEAGVGKIMAALVEWCIDPPGGASVDDLVAAIQKEAPRILNVCLAECWDQTGALRRRRLQFIHMLLTGRYPSPSPASIRTMPLASTEHVVEVSHRVAEVLLGVADATSNPASDRDIALGSLAALLETCWENAANVMGQNRSTCLTRLVPFGARALGHDGREPPQVCHARNLAAAAYACAMGRLDDSSDDIRVKALHVLAVCLHTMHCAQDAHGSGCELDEVGRRTFSFDDFTVSCLARGLGGSPTEDFLNELDCLLRKAAVLDPKAFLEAVDRYADEAGSTLAEDGKSMQLISDLKDHAEVLIMLQGCGA